MIKIDCKSIVIIFAAQLNVIWERFCNYDRFTFTTLWANSAEDKLIICFLIWPKKQDSTFHAKCLQWRQYWRQFACKVKPCFLGNIRKFACSVKSCFLRKIRKNISICCAERQNGQSKYCLPCKPWRNDPHNFITQSRKCYKLRLAVPINASTCFKSEIVKINV